jgi:UDP-N-acetylmuramoyl-L-alanyl-D-glutamate--2,6-diaminopimelate ligase
VIQTYAVRLFELIRHLPEPVALSGSNPLVHGIQLDSRKVSQGDMFVALEGGALDGHRFIPDAVARGAVAVAGTLPQPPDTDGALYPGADGRAALACLSAALYGFPARQMTMIGVTGTDGKTTTANLIYQILQAAGIQAGMISTVNALIGAEAIDTGFHVTTP